MSTLKFSTLAQKIRLAKIPILTTPAEEIQQLKGEIKFLKQILHMKQSSSGGISQILYEMKKLKEENENLKQIEKSQLNIRIIPNQSQLLRRSLNKPENLPSSAILTSSGSKLPFLTINKSRNEFSGFKRTSSFSRSTSKINKESDLLSPSNVELSGDPEEITPTKKPIRISFVDLPSIRSSKQSKVKTFSRSGFHEYYDEASRKKTTNSRSFRIDFSPEYKANLSLKLKESRSQVRVDRSLGEKSFKKLVSHRLGKSQSENPTNTKLTFFQYMKDQNQNQLFRQNNYSKNHFPKRDNLIRNTIGQKLRQSIPTELDQIGSMKSYLDNIQVRLNKLDHEDLSNSLTIPYPAHKTEKEPLSEYQKSLEGIKNQMKQFTFS